MKKFIFVIFFSLAVNANVAIEELWGAEGGLIFYAKLITYDVFLHLTSYRGL